MYNFIVAYFLAIAFFHIAVRLGGGAFLKSLGKNSSHNSWEPDNVEFPKTEKIAFQETTVDSTLIHTPLESLSRQISSLFMDVLLINQKNYSVYELNDKLTKIRTEYMKTFLWQETTGHIDEMMVFDAFIKQFDIFIRLCNYEHASKDLTIKIFDDASFITQVTDDYNKLYQETMALVTKDDQHSPLYTRLLIINMHVRYKIHKIIKDAKNIQKS